MFIDDALTINVSRNPLEPAVLDGELVVSFAELNDRMCRLHGALATLAERGDRVGILSVNTLEYLDALYAVPSAGMVLTTINPRLHPREWVDVANDSAVTVMLVHRDLLDQFLSVRESIPSLNHVIVLGGKESEGVIGYDELMAASEPKEPLPDRADDDIAWIIYTSGTTGVAKGVMLSHRNIVAGNITTMVEYGVRRRERQYFTMSLCHMGASGVMNTHFQGGSYVTAPAFEPGRFIDDIERYRISSTTLMPTMLRMLLDHPKMATADISSLKHLGFGGPMPVELLRECLARFGPIMASGFGMSEVVGTTCALRADDVVRAAESQPELLSSCGRPSMMVQVKIVDDDLNECAVGEVGEITVRGDNVCSGYHNKPDANAAAFQHGWFKTGDMAYRDEDGYLYVVDRKKDMIKSGGENVYSIEVERVIQDMPGIAEVAVIGLPHRKWIETVAAVVVLSPDSTVTEASIKTHCRQYLAGYKCPTVVHVRDSMPRSNGVPKILKHELRSIYADSAK